MQLLFSCPQTMISWEPPTPYGSYRLLTASPTSILRLGRHFCELDVPVWVEYSEVFYSLYLDKLLVSILTNV